MIDFGASFQLFIDGGPNNRSLSESKDEDEDDREDFFDEHHQQQDIMEGSDLSSSVSLAKVSACSGMRHIVNVTRKHEHWQ